MAAMTSPTRKKLPASPPAVAAGIAAAKGADGDARKQRSDGIEARIRLLHVALRLFAEKGFSKTSTREIAQAAGVNIASIKYYFGDKAGLYRAVFTEPMGSACDGGSLVSSMDLPLREALAIFLNEFVAPLKQSDLIQLCIRLHYREMLEPTGLWLEEIDNNIKPSHAALVAVLVRHMGIRKADDDVHRLAFSIVGLAVQMFISRDVVDAIRPSLIGTPAAIDQWVERLTDYAEAMVMADAARRAETVQAVAPSKKKKS